MQGIVTVVTGVGFLFVASASVGRKMLRLIKSAL